MKVINATTIGNLIKAHMEGDERKFLSYANFIQQSYEEDGDTLSAKIIRKSIDGSYKNEPQVSLDSTRNRCVYDITLTDSDIALVKRYNDGYHVPHALFFDPLYIEVVEEFVSLLNGSAYSTYHISDTDFIVETMEKNRGKTGVELLYVQLHPVVTIQEGINHICEALPIYKEEEKRREEEQKRNLELVKKEDTFRRKKMEIIQHKLIRGCSPVLVVKKQNIFKRSWNIFGEDFKRAFGAFGFLTWGIGIIGTTILTDNEVPMLGSLSLCEAALLAAVIWTGIVVIILISYIKEELWKKAVIKEYQQTGHKVSIGLSPTSIEFDGKALYYRSSFGTWMMSDGEYHYGEDYHMPITSISFSERRIGKKMGNFVHIICIDDVGSSVEHEVEMVISLKDMTEISIEFLKKIAGQLGILRAESHI